FRFLSNVPDPTDISTLSLHDALPIFARVQPAVLQHFVGRGFVEPVALHHARTTHQDLAIVGESHVEIRKRPTNRRRGKLLMIRQDRKSTRLNSSHVKNSYAVFCLKKK